MSVALELMRSEDLSCLSRKCAVAAATLSDWRHAFLSGGEAAWKIRYYASLECPALVA
ncbi:MAG: hypothetical protein IT163_00390 [Bryobacterales bacterium]|nr:hypothetical protein [Bryobacterales bacterium]